MSFKTKISDSKSMQYRFVGNKTIVKTIELRKLISHKDMWNVKCSTINNINNKDVLDLNCLL